MGARPAVFAVGLACAAAAGALGGSCESGLLWPANALPSGLDGTLAGMVAGLVWFTFYYRLIASMKARHKYFEAGLIALVSAVLFVWLGHCGGVEWILSRALVLLLWSGFYGTTLVWAVSLLRPPPTP